MRSFTQQSKGKIYFGGGGGLKDILRSDQAYTHIYMKHTKNIYIDTHYMYRQYIDIYIIISS